jgi:hypothetical protein
MRRSGLRVVLLGGEQQVEPVHAPLLAGKLGFALRAPQKGVTSSARCTLATTLILTTDVSIALFTQHRRRGVLRSSG